MRFFDHYKKRLLRIVAGLALLACSMWIGAAFLSLPLILVGFGVIGYQSVQMWRERDRRDPYDLSRLREAPPLLPEEPEEDDKERDMVFCHRCGSSMAQAHSICPGCGSFL